MFHIIQKSVNLRIGDINCLLDSNDDRLIRRLKETYPCFLTTEEPDIRIKAQVDKKLKCNTNILIWHNYVKGSDILFQSRDFSGSFNLKKYYGDVRFYSLSDNAVYIFLATVYSTFLPFFGGFLIHAASVSCDEDSFLFPGGADSGKSTVAILSLKDHQCLSDDISLVRKIKDEYYLFSTPFWNYWHRMRHYHQNNLKTRLKGVYFLKKSMKNYIELMKVTEGIQRLMSHSLVFVKEPNISKNVFELCYHYGKRGSFYNLHFLKNKSFWKHILNGK
jgi:hypothetical protein